MRNATIGLPAGFRDLLFDESKKRRVVEAKLASVFERQGYGEVSPSGIEFLDIYARGNQGIKDKTFKFLDRDDNLLALRADFTPAIARIAAARLQNMPLPIKIWYSGSVFRKADLHRGRFHEFIQVGAELLGQNTAGTDAEVLNLAMLCLSALGIRDIQVHVNHAGIFRGIVNALKLDRQALKLVKSKIDRKDMRGLASRLETLGVAQDLRQQMECLSRSVGGLPVLATARSAITNPESRRAIDELAGLASSLESWKEHIVFDLTEIDEMEYYTGIMFEIFCPGLTSELGRGGRYDALLRDFGADMPAIGFSFSMDRLVELA